MVTRTGTPRALVQRMLDTRSPVATIVLEHSECAPVLARHRIDYCCKGKKPLADACRDPANKLAANTGLITGRDS